MKRWTWYLLINLYLGLILFTNRAAFFSHFDADYWKDRYEHSQWKLPLSSRTIGDDGLFLYEGYRLSKGDNPIDYNAEVPPLGKYLIGLSVSVFGNGHWFGFATTAAALFVFYLLAQRLLSNRVAAAATLLFALDPLFINQWPLTMLDSLQLFFLLLTMFMLTIIIKLKTPSIFLSISLGLSFGLFSATKTPVFSPLLGLICILILRKPKPIVFFFISSFFAYLAPYARYFFLDHTFTDWIGVQRWMVGFYKTSLLAPNTGSALTTLLFGRIQDLFTHSWEPASQWSPVWPLVMFLSIGAILRSAKNYTLVVMAGFVTLLLTILSVIPFWTRYLLLVLPFLYIASMHLITTVKKPFWLTLVTGLGIVNIFASVDTIFPTPEAAVKTFVYSWEHGFFQDMYEQVALASRLTDRQVFHRFGLKTWYDGQIEATKITLVNPHWSRWRSPQIVKLQVTYFTRELGPFAENRTISVVNEEGKWVIPWQWTNLLEGFDQTKHLQTSVVPAPRGSILASDGTLLAQDIPGFMVWITPNKVDRTKEEALLSALEVAFHKHPGAAGIHHRYVGNTLSDLPIPIGTITNQVEQFPGISFTPHLIRVPSSGITNTVFKECCSFLYSSTNYDGVTDLEKIYNIKLKARNGGTLVIKDQQENIFRTIIDLAKQDGKDVTLKL